MELPPSLPPESTPSSAQGHDAPEAKESCSSGVHHHPSYFRMQANPEKVESAANSEMKAMVFGDTAFVHGLFIVKSTTNGKDTSRQSRYTEVYVKRDGRWQCVTGHSTKVE
jgi:ketosteroid isomerase-like protein